MTKGLDIGGNLVSIWETDLDDTGEEEVVSLEGGLTLKICWG